MAREKRLVSRAEVGRQAGVSRKTVTKACVSRLKAALTGKRLDIDHPAVIDFIETAKGAKTKKGENLDKSGNGHYSKGAALEDYMNWTLRDLVMKFGTDDNFKRWADGAKVVVDIQLKDLKAAEMRGELITRDDVKTHIFGAFENSNLRLLSDAPKTISQRLKALFKSGGTIEEGEELVREINGSMLKGIKATAVRVLKKKNVKR